MGISPLGMRRCDRDRLHGNPGGSAIVNRSQSNSSTSTNFARRQSDRRRNSIARADGHADH